MSYIPHVQTNELQGWNPQTRAFPTLVSSVTCSSKQADAEISVHSIICSFTIGCRKCSPQLKTLKPNESNIMSLTCHWIKPRKNAVGTTVLPPLKSCLGFLLFCCYRHFNRLLDIVFPIKVFSVLLLFFSVFTDVISFLLI